MNTYNKHRIKLRSLFIKPTLACTANCLHCRHRQELYRQIENNNKLKLPDYARLFHEVRKIGTESLHISGGEPTLYDQLPDLIAEGKRHKWFVILNTNGSTLNFTMASELFRAGLDAVIVSLQSTDPVIHDAMRQKCGHLNKIVESIGLLQRMKKKFNPNFLLSTQTIITKKNYLDLPNIVRLVCQLDSDAHGFSYLEGDFERELLLSVEEIMDLKQTIIPEMLEVLNAYPFKNSILKYAAMRSVAKLYNEKITSLESYSKGVYRDKKYTRSHCRAPEIFAMVLPNGDVHPCNMVEYVHAPIVGNILKQEFYEIWQGQMWNEFRQERFMWCHYCPAHIHFHIPLAITMAQVLRLALKNPAPEQKSIKERIACSIFA